MWMGLTGYLGVWVWATAPDRPAMETSPTDMNRLKINDITHSYGGIGLLRTLIMPDQAWYYDAI
jgi:hypothetical protein